MKERRQELEKMLSEVCGIYENNCSKCPRQKECEEYSKLIWGKEKMTTL